MADTAQTGAREAGWMFDVEGDYLAARDLDPAPFEARVEALLAEPGDAAERFVAEAAERNDLAAVLGGGAALRRQARLSGRNLDSYVQALRAERRFAEAADLTEALVAAHPHAAVYHMALAEAAAGAGRLQRAREAAERANLLQPSLEAANLARRLKWVGKLHRQLETIGWTDARKLVEGCLFLQAADLAVEAIVRVSRRPPPGEPPFEDLVRLAIKALRLGLPRLAGPMIDRLAEARPDDPDVRRLMIECAGRLGYGVEAARVADSLTGAQPAAEALDADDARARGQLRLTQAAAFLAAGRAEDSVRALDPLVMADARDFDALHALRRAVGQYVLERCDPAWAAPRPPRIINILPFYKERALFDLRLAEMGDWVDHFVVVEAAEAFTGRPKPLHFADAMGEFAGRGDQILHVAVEAFPAAMRSAWAREYFQRDMAIKALAGLWRPDDIVLITDADEIVDRRAVRGGGWPTLANLRMATSKYFFNYVADPNTHHGNRRSGAVCRAATLARFGASHVRSGLSTVRKRWESMAEAGWHFTNITDAAGLADKFTDFSHQEASKAPLRDVSGAAGVLDQVRAGAREPGWSVRPVDGRLPAFVRDNRARLTHLMLPDPAASPP